MGDVFFVDVDFSSGIKRRRKKKELKGDNQRKRTRFA